MDNEVVARELVTLIDLEHTDKQTRFERQLLELFDRNDFFSFQKLLECKTSSFFDNKKELTPELRQLLEEILKNSDDKSAAYISLMWETLELWNTDDILIASNKSKHSLISCAIQSGNIRNLFSFLMFDWHNPDRYNEDINYFLDLKFKCYQQETTMSLFSKLYETIDAEEAKYQHVCLRIMYQFLHELNKSVMDQTNDRKVEIYGKLETLMNIDYVLTMKDEEFKKKILKVFVTYWYKSEDKDYSKYKSTLMDISPFFELAFMLKERLNSTFEKTFEKFIVDCKKKNGFYYEVKLKVNNRLLLYIADQHNLTQIRSFIFRKCAFNEINATPLTNAQEISKVLNLNIYPWTTNEQAILKKLRGAYEILAANSNEPVTKPVTEAVTEPIHDDNAKKLWQQHRKVIDTQLKVFRDYLAQIQIRNNKFFGSYKTARNLLFERQSNQLSFFEEILKTPGMKEIIELVWEMSDILKNENILQTQNPVGKHLIDYAIESNDDTNLIAFIIPNHSNKISLLTRRHLVKIQNEQYLSKTGITLFERFMYIEKKWLRDKFFDVPFCLLEEIDEIDDIREQTEIDRLILFLDVNRNEEKIIKKTSQSALNNVKRIIDVIKARAEVRAEAEVETEAKVTDEDDNDYEYDFNKLLRYSLKYWQEPDINFEYYKEKLLKTGDPMFKMIIQIIEDKVDEFKRTFYDNVTILFNRYQGRYGKNENERLIQEDMFLLFRTAIKHGRDQIVEFILDYESFETLPFELPRHNRATQHCYFAAQKLLQHGYELSHEGIPPYWITEQVLRDFLDSQIDNYDENLIRINMSFLMSSNDRKFKINDKSDVSDKLLFNEHTGTLNYILENEQIKCLLQHPVVSTYISLKTFKFQFIHRLNFFFFFFSFLLPFVFLINFHASDNNQYSLFQQFFQFICFLSTLILGIREFVQLKWFYKNRKAYLSDFDNQIELLMIALSWVVLISIFTLNIRESLDLFSFVSTLLIIVSTITMMSMLPFSAVPLYMRMLRNVTVTFFKFFSFFVFIVFAFSVSFFVIFKPKHLNGKTSASNSTSDTINREEEEAIDDKNNSEVYQNFGTLMGSFFKTLLMLSGEYTIEPFTLSVTKMIIFFIFVITSFIVFNLIIALAITDVKELTDEAEALDLYYKSKKFIKSSAKWKEFYAYFQLEKGKQNKLPFVKRWTVKAIRFVLYNHYYVHKLDTVFLNLQTLEVTIKVNKRYESPLTTQFGSNSKFIMNSESFQRIKEIIKKRDEKDFRQLKKKMEEKQVSESDMSSISP